MENQEQKPIPAKCRILKSEVIALILFLIISAIDFAILYPGCQEGLDFTFFLYLLALIFFLFLLIKSILFFKKDKRCATRRVIRNIVFLLITIAIALFIDFTMHMCPSFYEKCIGCF